MTELGRILGLDYGEKRIGVAISDPLQITAQPLKTIQYGLKEVLWNQLDEIIGRYEIEIIVLGLPLHMNGSDSLSSGIVKRFAEEVQNRYEIAVEFWDERLTSTEAEKILRELGKKPSRKKEEIDRLAAVLILQGYLQRKQSFAVS